jgi:hypothetical protein
MRQQNISKQRQRLLELMRELRYGRIENITILDGEPAFDPTIRVIREVLLGKKEKNRAAPSRDDFELKTQMVELFEQFDLVQNGIISLLKVQDGLPFQLQLEEPVTV